MPLRIIDLNSIGTNLVPTSNVTYDLGTANNAWKDLFLSGNTISLGGASISTDDSTGAVTIVPKVTEANPNPKATLIKADGVASVNTSGGVVSSNSIAAASAGGSSITVYATIAELPLSGNDAGAMAFVSATNRLYLWSGSGWFNIALLNQSPTITSGPNASYTLASDGTPLVLTLTAQDPEGFPLTWSYSVTSGTLGSTVVSQANNIFTITPSTNEADDGEFSITFTASDGINLATAASTFTLEFEPADAYYNLNSTLIKTGSTAELTNATIIDESTNGFTVTRTGDVYQGSYSPYSPAGWSNYFDGTGDYIVVNNSPGFSADFTFECWLNSPAPHAGHILAKYPGSGGVIDTFFVNATTGTASCIFRSGAAEIVSTSNVCDGRWHHVAYSRTSGSFKLFVDGVLQATTTNTEECIFLDGTTPWYIGRHGNYEGPNFNGYLADVRLVLGTGLYTANFNVPTEPLTSVSGTSILACQGNSFRDVSGNHTLSPSGDVKVVPNSPYLPSFRYDPAVHGGSMYFDGVGDYITAPIPSIGTGDFTIECWIYPISFGSYGGVFTLAGISTPVGVTVNVDQWWVGTAGSVNTFVTGNKFTLNAWQHIAVVRSGSTITGYVNGISVGSATNSTNITATSMAVASRYVGDYSYLTNAYISDLRVVNGTAVYTSNFTPPTQLLTAISGTSLLVRGANAGVYDEMGKNNISMIGNATTSTTVTKYNSTSMYFDGTGDYLAVPASPNNILSTKNFTVECWIYINSLPSNVAGIVDTGTSVNANRFSLVLYSNGKIYIDNNTNLLISTSSLSTGVWYHIAAVRSGTGTNQTALYINGVQDKTATIATDFSNNFYRVGSTIDGYSLNGYIEDLRITKGYARYTANFTPPTAALGYSNAE